MLEFDFEVRYRKGTENTVADAISMLLTFGHTNIDPDLEVPCLLTNFDNATGVVVVGEELSQLE